MYEVDKNCKSFTVGSNPLQTTKMEKNGFLVEIYTITPFWKKGMFFESIDKDLV